MTIEPNWITNLVNVVAGATVILTLWLAWKQYKYQKMESTIKADTQIKQNEEIIAILKNIEKKSL